MIVKKMTRLLFLAVFMTLTLNVAHAAEKTFTVDSTLDDSDFEPGDGICANGRGNCTLRAAIEEANTVPTDTYTVNLGTRTICVPSVLSAINIASLTLRGDGPANTILDAGNSSATYTSGCSTPNTGAILDNTITTLTLDQLKLVGANNTTTLGGALYLAGSTTITNSEFSHNTAAHSGYDTGGAIYFNSAPGSLQISDSIFTHNTALGGGAIAFRGYGTSSGSITRCLFSNNIASSSGGAIIISSALNFTVDQSLFENNQANSYGGAIDSNNNTVTAITNTTFYENEATDSASGYGGAVSSYYDTNFALFATTFSENTGANGMGFSAISSTVSMKSNLFADANDTTETECAVESSAVVNSYGFNLVKDSRGCSFVYATSHASSLLDLIGQDPLLTALENHGGGTQTLALQAGSPAIGTGSCTNKLGLANTIDQRGVARNSPCDIGAYESGSDETGLCTDGSDNDNDTLVDCADSECSTDAACTSTSTETSTENSSGENPTDDTSSSDDGESNEDASNDDSANEINSESGSAGTSSTGSEETSSDNPATPTPGPDPTPVVITSSGGGGGCNLNTGVFQTGNMGLISITLLLLSLFRKQQTNRL